MAHLLDIYSRTTGLRIEKMHVYEQFFPLPDGFDKYILVCTGSGMAAKNYSYFADVIWMIKEMLHKSGIKIIQIGGKDDERINADYDVCGGTSKYQFPYLVRNCELVLCNDSSILHLAGHYNKPVVSMFGITDPNISGAYFGDKSKQVYLTPVYEHGYPSFNPHERPKTIDKIMPERAANAIAQLLKLKNDSLSTIYLGEQYRFQALEVVPDHIFPPNYFTKQMLNIRLDYGGEEETVYNFLTQRKCNVMTNRPINVDILTQVRPHIGTIVYEITEDHDPQFVERLHREGINYLLLSYLPAEKLQELKLTYFEFNLIHPKKRKARKDVPNIDKITTASEFRSNKFILSKGKIYLSRAHWQAEVSIPSFDKNVGPVLDNDLFWKEVDFFHLFNRNVLK